MAKPSETTFKLASHFKSKEPRFKGTSPRTWTIWAKDFSTLVVVRGIELNSQGFLNTNSKQLVKGMSKCFHLKKLSPLLKMLFREHHLGGGDERINLH